VRGLATGTGRDRCFSSAYVGISSRSQPRGRCGRDLGDVGVHADVSTRRRPISANNVGLEADAPRRRDTPCGGAKTDIVTARQTREFLKKTRI